MRTSGTSVNNGRSIRHGAARSRSPRRSATDAAAAQESKASGRADGLSGETQPKGVKKAASLHLSPTDAAFIYLESRNLPLAIANLNIFDGAIPFDRWVAIIQSKLHLFPRLRQIVVTPPMNLGLPTWEDDPHFDIRRHIFPMTLKSPGGEAELQALMGRVLSQLLDRSKPLWELHVVAGLEGGRGALIWRLHHALCDGISASRMIASLLDTSAEAPPLPHQPRPEPVASPTSARTLAEEIGEAVKSTLQGLIAAEAGILSFAETLMSDRMRDGLKGLKGLLPELAASVERLPFNKPCSGDRKFCWADVSLADIEAIRQVAGGTMNDVVLTVLTRALVRYVKLHGETTVNRFVRVVCPVSLRGPNAGANQGEGLGNQISFMPVALPMDVRGPLQTLKAVASRTETMKRSGAANMVALAAACVAAAPPPLQALLWKGIPQFTLPVPLFNMICTNVPGSPVPLYAAGRRMLESYPVVPTGWDLGINVAVQSYDGKLFFGLIADAHAASDVNRLRDFLYVSFRELRRAAGAKRAGSKRNGPREKPRPVASIELPRAAEAVPKKAPEQKKQDAPAIATPATVTNTRNAA